VQEARGQPIRDEIALHGAEKCVFVERRDTQRRRIESLLGVIRERDTTPRQIDAAHEEAAFLDVELAAKMPECDDVLAFRGQVADAAFERGAQSRVRDRLAFVPQAAVALQDQSERA
jgi:hypothetical protein